MSIHKKVIGGREYVCETSYGWCEVWDAPLNSHAKDDHARFKTVAAALKAWRFRCAHAEMVLKDEKDQRERMERSRAASSAAQDVDEEQQVERDYWEQRIQAQAEVERLIDPEEEERTAEAGARAAREFDEEFSPD